MLFGARRPRIALAMLKARCLGGYGLPLTAAFGARFWQGMGWGIATVPAVILLVIRAFGGYSFGKMVLQGPALWGYAVLWGRSCNLASSKSFLFRGYAQFTLSTGIGFWPAAVALSAAFGAIHLHNGGKTKSARSTCYCDWNVFFALHCGAREICGSPWSTRGSLGRDFFLFFVPDSGIVAPKRLNSSFHGSAAQWVPEGGISFGVVGLATILL